MILLLKLQIFWPGNSSHLSFVLVPSQTDKNKNFSSHSDEAGDSGTRGVAWVELEILGLEHDDEAHEELG